MQNAMYLNKEGKAFQVPLQRRPPRPRARRSILSRGWRRGTRHCTSTKNKPWFLVRLVSRLRASSLGLAVAESYATGRVVGPGQRKRTKNKVATEFVFERLNLTCSLYPQCHVKLVLR